VMSAILLFPNYPAHQRLAARRFDDKASALPLLQRKIIGMKFARDLSADTRASRIRA
jgi:hypothetical protein